LPSEVLQAELAPIWNLVVERNSKKQTIKTIGEQKDMIRKE
jgi:hypothetical protein